MPIPMVIPSPSKPKVSGYVVEMNINDNSFVHAGDLMLKIDPRDYINASDTAAANLELAKAQLLQAQVNYEIAKVKYPAQLIQAEAQKKQSDASAYAGRPGIQAPAQRQSARNHAVECRYRDRASRDRLWAR